MTNKKVLKQLEKAKHASLSFGLLSHAKRNLILKNLIAGLRDGKRAIITANKKDVAYFAKINGASHPMVDRLVLNETRIEGMISELHGLIKMKDPIGERFDERKRLGMDMARVRVPMGLLGIIYESRPNVTTDVAGIAIKSGNAVALKGGKEARESYIVLHKIIRKALIDASADREAVQFVDPKDKDAVATMLGATGLVDVIIPRGSQNLINFVRDNATVPVIETGAGVCHTFVDESAKVTPSAKIIFNAKTQRPSVCNALDTLLVHKKIAEKLLLEASKLLMSKEVEIFADPLSYRILAKIYPKNLLKKAKTADFGREFLSQKMSVKIVASLDEALAHIHKYSSKHSEAILSDNKKNLERFLREVDSATVYANASTRFSDGAVFGVGSEIGISTDKMHARGPMGPKEMTTYKWVVKGSYSTRK